MSRRSEPGRWTLPFTIGIALGLALAIAYAVLAWPAWWSGRSEDGSGGTSGGFLRTVQADVGRGEYLFLPCRREMWVVNKVNGKLVHYQFFDNELGTVERSRIVAINQELFPLRDTDFLLSDRNLNSLLWVANRATGDFQLWRANRDGTLSTDKEAVSAGTDLRQAPSEPSPVRAEGRLPGRRQIGGGQAGAPETPQPGAAQPKRRLEPQVPAPATKDR